MPASSTLDRDPSLARTIDAFFDADPTAPRASLGTVIVGFLGVAIAQVALVVMILLTFEGSALRIAVMIAIIVPSTVYAIIAAWDHGQLVASGQPDAPSWFVALVAPPVYLVLRWVRITADRPGRIRGIVAGSVLQLVVTACLAALVGAATLAFPASSADARPTAEYTAAQIADLSTPTGIESEIEAQWRVLGTAGTAECSAVPSTAPGTDVTCSADYEGRSIRFTVQFIDSLPGARPWDVVSWTVVA